VKIPLETEFRYRLQDVLNFRIFILGGEPGIMGTLKRSLILQQFTAPRLWGVVVRRVF